MNVISTGHRSLGWALLSLTTIVMTSGAPVYAQNGNLSKWIFWQNNQIKKELAELKKEVRGPASTSTSESPLVTIFAVVFSAGLVAAALWFLWRSCRQADLFGEMRRVKAGQFQEAWKARGRNVFMHCFAPLFALSLCGLVAILPNVDPGQLDQMQTLLLVGGLSLPLLASGIVPLIVVSRMTQERYRPRYDQLKMATHNSYQCFVRLPDGEIKGPGDKDNIRVLAKQGKYPPGTVWAEQADGPWVTIPSVKGAGTLPPSSITSAVQWWIRTPDGKQSGPHTTEQLSKAAAAGRLPQGTVAANSPNGPWKQVRLQKQA